jgi:phage terminase small subunit
VARKSHPTKRPARQRVETPATSTRSSRPDTPQGKRSTPPASPVKTTSRRREKPKPEKVAAPPELPHVAAGLQTAAQYEFCLAYLTNGYNATQAYLSAHPDVKNPTARVEGHRDLTKPNIQRYLASKLGNRWKAWDMEAEEASARLAQDARADLRLLFDEDGALLDPKDWPDELANSIESYEAEKGKVKLVSKLHARRTILELTGKLKNPLATLGESLDSLLAGIEKERQAKKGAE